jgi:hypothetical protein
MPPLCERPQFAENRGEKYLFSGTEAVMELKEKCKNPKQMGE